MKRVLCLFVILIFLAGCSGENRELERCLALRERLLVTGCQFTGIVTADFGDKIYTFNLECIADSKGSLQFTVKDPEEIAGIGGTVLAGKGKLEYQDAVLAFPLLAEGEISPVSAPWILVNALRSGNMISGGKEGDYLLLTVRDSFAENALELDVWLDEQNIPVKAEILWQGRRAVSIALEDFRFV